MNRGWFGESYRHYLAAKGYLGRRPMRDPYAEYGYNYAGVRGTAERVRRLKQFREKYGGVNEEDAERVPPPLPNIDPEYAALLSSAKEAVEAGDIPLPPKKPLTKYEKRVNEWRAWRDLEDRKIEERKKGRLMLMDAGASEEEAVDAQRLYEEATGQFYAKKGANRYLASKLGEIAARRVAVERVETGE